MKLRFFILGVSIGSSIQSSVIAVGIIIAFLAVVQDFIVKIVTFYNEMHPQGSSLLKKILILN